MENHKDPISSHGLLWFGASVSIAEILTGTFISPLGFSKGIAAIITGHLIGGVLIYFAGLLGARSGRGAMDTAKLSFGEKGAALFSVLNVLQLIGWTAIMTASGASAANLAANGAGGYSLWSLAIGVLILVWLVMGMKNLGKINIVIVGALFLMTVGISLAVFRGNPGSSGGGSMSFGAAVELSAAMPLSWLPLVADYTKGARRKKAVSFASAFAYTAGSIWMYAIGLGAAVFLGESDIAVIMAGAGFGILGIYVVIASTVTTTFLDVFSAGESFASISKWPGRKAVAAAACVIGTLLALSTDVFRFEGFLYLIGSVFAPMAAIMLTDHFILGKDSSGEAFNVMNLGLWAAGFMAYRQFMSVDTILGSTLPVMALISVATIIMNGGIQYVKNASGKEQA
ncbi:putative hydroxymethylpyrimidine transporter CytX [Youngiibacter fragilis]|uniref:Hydrogenase expression protein n=1 Tax=Youngiibacter fragilis 232.1 TaxID=994573 RepID=V7HYM6_9CLOT|nr:putative hydroxymethylpyrimidine transporter CytX [Youngiibacter fragilis]ETA79075.1 hydrogenase expression protein [Youngiibacter fragilis 232.1]